MITIRPHHLKILCGYLHNFNLVRLQCIDNKYTDGFVDEIYNLCIKISNTKDLKIKIIPTIDTICSICLKKSPRSRTKDCSSQKFHLEEYESASFYNIDIYKIYSSKELLDHIVNSTAYLQSFYYSKNNNTRN